MWVVVVDGVMVGHPYCAVHNCFEPLETQQNCFCKGYEATEGRVCVIKGCTQLHQKDAHVCSDPEHVEVE